MKKPKFNELMANALIDTGIKITITKRNVHNKKRAPAGQVYFVAAAKRGKNKFTAFVLYNIEDLTPVKENQIHAELEDHMKKILAKNLTP